MADRLRQKDGLSYGAGSSFSASARDGRGALMINAICNPGNAGRVVKGVDEEVARILQDGVTEKELDLAKTGFSRQQEVRRSNDAALAGQLASHLELGRTLRFDADLERTTRDLTPDSVAAALRKHIVPKRLTVVVGGDVAPDLVH